MAAPAAKRSRAGLRPEDLAVGSAVLYWEDQEGVVSDAFAPLNQFWVRCRATGEVVRDENGEIVAFAAEQLRLASAPGVGAGQGRSSARVLLIGTELQMLKIIDHFGAPDISERREPQMLLAMPCASCCCGQACEQFESSKLQTCDPKTCPMLKLAAQGVEPPIFELARRLRPDLQDQIQIRAYHLKQAMEQLGPDLRRLNDFYCLSSVSLPFGMYDIEAASIADREAMETRRCQIDLDVSAEGFSIAGDSSLDVTAKRVLGESCGVYVADRVWDEGTQTRLRKALGVDLPVKYFDGPNSKGYVLLLPSDLSATVQDGLLMFSEPTGQPAQRATGAADSKAIGTRTIADWKKCQDEFAHLPKLPPDWIRVKSRSSRTSGEEVYYYNVREERSTFDFPLPDGWTKQVSKSTGKVYYFNARKRQSVFEIPTE